MMPPASGFSLLTHHAALQVVLLVRVLLQNDEEFFLVVEVLRVDNVAQPFEQKHGRDQVRGQFDLLHLVYAYPNELALFLHRVARYVFQEQEKLVLCIVRVFGALVQELPKCQVAVEYGRQQVALVPVFDILLAQKLAQQLGHIEYRVTVIHVESALSAEQEWEYWATGSSRFKRLTFVVDLIALAVQEAFETEKDSLLQDQIVLELAVRAYEQLQKAQIVLSELSLLHCDDFIQVSHEQVAYLKLLPGRRRIRLDLCEAGGERVQGLHEIAHELTHGVRRGAEQGQFDPVLAERFAQRFKNDRQERLVKSKDGCEVQGAHRSTLTF
jgi:hypothetical protein